MSGDFEVESGGKPGDFTVAAPKKEAPNPKDAIGRKKPGISCIPPVAILEEGVVMALGAQKYGAFNWSDHPVLATVYYDAAFRHMASWFAGELIDPESGASHLAHSRACLGILIDAQYQGNLIDDRPLKTTSAAATVKRLSER